MTELSTLARPYAEAVFKRAKETNSMLEWADELLFLSEVAKNPSLIGIFNNPKVSKESISQLLLDISQDQIKEEAKNLLKILIDNAKIALLPKISEMFEVHKAEAEGYVNVELISAYALSKAELSKYSTMLEKQLHKKVNAVVTIDKSLLGGVLAKAGDKVIDGSIKGQIHQLAKKL